MADRIANLAPGSQDLDSLGAQQALDVIWRGKWVMLAAMLVGAAVALFVVAQITPSFTGTVRIALENRNLTQNAAFGGAEETEISTPTFLTEMKMLRSPALLGRVADRLDLYSVDEFTIPAQSRTVQVKHAVNGIAERLGVAPPFTVSQPQPLGQHDVVERLRSRVQVYRDGTSYVMIVNAVSADPELAAAISNEVADQYLEWQHSRRQSSLQMMSEWLDTRIENVRKDLEQAEERVAETKAENLSESGLTEDDLQARLNDTNRVLARLRTQLAENDVRLEEFQRLKKAGSDAANSIPAQSDTIAMLKGRLAEFGSMKIDLIATYGTNNDKIARIEEYETVAKQELSAAIEAQLTSQRDITARQYDIAQETAADLEEQIQTLSKGTLALWQREREAKSLQDVYANLLTLRNKNDVRQPMPVVEASIFDTAQPPDLPSAPRPRLITAIGAVLGVMAGFAFVVLRQISNPDQRFRETIQSEFGLPLLAEIPRGRWRKLRVSDWMNRKKGFAFVEAVRQLRTSLMFTDASEPKVIMVTSANPRAGKTTLTIALATLYASIGKQVLALDGDLRRPRLSSLISKDEGVDLITLLKEDSAFEPSIAVDPNLNFDILTFATGDRPTSVDALSTPAFKLLLGKLAEKYDTILIDTPPISIASDALVIGAMADTTIFVHRKTRGGLGAVRSAIHRLIAMNIPIAGVVDNMRSSDPTTYGYTKDPRTTASAYVVADATARLNSIRTQISTNEKFTTNRKAEHTKGGVA